MPPRSMAKHFVLAGLAFAISACTIIPQTTPPTTGTGDPYTSPVSPGQGDGPGQQPPVVSPGSDPVAAPIPAIPRPTIAVPPVPAAAATAREAGVVRGAPVSSYRIPAAEARSALAAFRLSCPSLVRRTDTSGLTLPGDWTEACAAASVWNPAEASSFFERHLTPVQVGDGAVLATGYYEPEIAGSLVRGGPYQHPIYGKPFDLIDGPPDANGKSSRGKYVGGKFVPYDSRAEIIAGSLNGRAPILAWAADPVEFFFLQIQGSGRVDLPDGNVLRIGYASTNSRPYRSVGRLMLDRGLLAPGQSTMQGIVAWLKTHPDQADEIMNANESFVFFNELTGPGPLGAMGYAVSPRTSVAADPKFVPLGAPVILSLDRAEPSTLWVAQDTGGAIKGSNRFDTFWGAGAQARAIAGGMAARGSALILIPHVSAARLLN